jgi:hypothetical protein
MLSLLMRGARRRHVLIGCAVVAALMVGVVVGTVVATKNAEAQGRTFTAGAGMMLNYVNAANESDFEGVMEKLAEGLRASENADRNAQAEGWKVYKAQEAGPGGSTLYVWFIDPAVSGADYAVAQILNEAFPAEVQGLYETFNGSFAGGQSMVNLDLVLDF